MCGSAGNVLFHLRESLPEGRECVVLSGRVISRFCLGESFLEGRECVVPSGRRAGNVWFCLGESRECVVVWLHFGVFS